MKERSSENENQEDIRISLKNVKTVIKKTNNWKGLVLTVFRGIGLRGFQHCTLGN